MGGFAPPLSDHVGDVVGLELVQRGRGAFDRLRITPPPANLQRPSTLRIGAVPGILHDDLPRAAVEANGVVQSQGNGRGNLGGEPVGELQQGGRPLVDAAGTHLPVAADLVGLGTRDQPRHGDRIAADVHDAAAAEGVAEEAARRVEVGVKAEAGLDVANLADGPFPHQLHKAKRLRMASVHERFHEECLALLGLIDDGHHLGVVEPCRLLAEHGLARAKRAYRPLGVVGVRGGDVDGVDFGVVHQLGVGPVGARHVEGPREGLGGLSPAAADGLKPARRRQLYGPGERVSDAARRENTPADGHRAGSR